ncbi:peptidoglycan-N-acetylmuramic acid deacetylase [Alkalibacillus flavidus]|uniref:Peptidoglycan-N-acetylmuramic acid deacetylase n=1 Tax=Alkalibacillus flavidus TaxID=546021 RepID=A0ABV2KWR2_9BACI
MKKIILMLLSVLLIPLTIHADDVSNESYGYGYKKQYNEQPPDLGFYAPLIEQYNGIYIGDQSNKNVYLTFDSGYEQGYMTQMLDVLEDKQVPATFFLSGHYIDDQPKLVKRMVDDGHIIGNHSDDHLDYTKASDDEIKRDLKRLDDKIKQTTDQDVVEFFRPAKGIFSERTLKLTDELGYTNVFWSVALVDWEESQQTSWQQAVDDLIEQMHPGAVVLMHTVTEDNAEALSHLIDELRDQGYEFKSLEQLVWNKHIPFG